MINTPSQQGHVTHYVCSFPLIIIINLYKKTTPHETAAPVPSRGLVFTERRLCGWKRGSGTLRLDRAAPGARAQLMYTVCRPLSIWFTRWPRFHCWVVMATNSPTTFSVCVCVLARCYCYWQRAEGSTGDAGDSRCWPCVCVSVVMMMLLMTTGVYGRPVVELRAVSVGYWGMEAEMERERAVCQSNTRTVEPQLRHTDLSVAKNGTHTCCCWEAIRSFYMTGVCILGCVSISRLWRKNVWETNWGLQREISIWYKT